MVGKLDGSDLEDAKLLLGLAHNGGDLFEV